MRSLSEFPGNDRKRQEIDEPSPANAQRTGLWRILALSTFGAVVALALTAALVL